MYSDLIFFFKKSFFCGSIDPLFRIFVWIQPRKMREKLAIVAVLALFGSSRINALNKVHGRKRQAWLVKEDYLQFVFR